MSSPDTSGSWVFPPGLVVAGEHVKITTLKPRLLDYLGKVGSMHVALFGRSMIITSGNDGQHAPGSKHYTNEAADVRSKDKTAVEAFFFLAVLDYVGEQYGVAVFDERSSSTEPHYHVELAE